MKRKLLLDPWVLEGVFESFSPERLKLIERFVEELRRDGASEPVPVLDPNFYDRFYRMAPAGTKKLMLRWLTRLVRDSPGVQQATVSPMPEDVSDAWKESLFETCIPDECDTWRSATLIVPAARSGTWPRQVETDILGLVGPARRLVAQLDHLDEHPEYRHDVNPWLFRACADEKREKATSSYSHPCRLPVPPELLPDTRHQDAPVTLDHPLGAWGSQLAQARKTGWLRVGYGYYIPPPEWSAPEVDRSDWRKRGAFPTTSKSTAKGIKTGPVDYLGQVWWWDVEEHHWDVQDADPAKPAAYITISETGLKR